MPDQSWYPLMACTGLLIGAFNFAQLKHPVIMFGHQVLSSHLPLALTGGAILLLGCYLWSLEGPGGYHIHLDEKGNATESRGGHH
jgi:cytochrome c oxidase subunit 1